MTFINLFVTFLNLLAIICCTIGATVTDSKTIAVACIIGVAINCFFVVQNIDNRD